MNQPHPDDELLSASLDGEADTATDQHLAGCDACRARRAALDGARRAVGTPPPPPSSSAVDRAISAALGATDDERPAAPVVPLHRPAATGSRSDGTILPSARQRRPPAWLLGAAAAVAAIGLAVPLLAGGDSGTVEQTALSAKAGRSVADRADEGGLDGGDLGELSDAFALRDRIAGSVSGGAAAGAATEAASPAPAAAPAPISAGAITTTTSRNPLRAGDTSGAPEVATSVDGDQPLDSAPAAGTPAPSTTASAPTSVAPAASVAAPQYTSKAATGSAPCASQARSDLGSRVGPLVYRALVTWQGTPAVVLGYRLSDTSGPGPDHLALVMATADCRILVSQGF